ncbi:MAG: cytochrome c [Pseudomonadota bacterium]
MITRPFTVLFCTLAIALFASCGSETEFSGPVDDDEDLKVATIAYGGEIVQALCSDCHATSADGDSPRADAPPLRHALAHYSADALEEDFRNGMAVNHSDMPTFELTPQSADAVLAYLKSIQAPPV